jgi:hypothetical protein
MNRALIKKYKEDVELHKDEFLFLECTPYLYWPNRKSCKECYYYDICIGGKMYFRKRCVGIYDMGERVY